LLGLVALEDLVDIAFKQIIGGGGADGGPEGFGVGLRSGEVEDGLEVGCDDAFKVGTDGVDGRDDLCGLRDG
jgi:hypothetical protein